MSGGSTRTGQGTLFAFDQNGVTGCSSGTCRPEFQTSGGPGVPTPINLAVSGSTVYGTTGNGTSLLAFNGAGCGQASCTGALWSTGRSVQTVPPLHSVGDIGAPNVSNGVVYVGIFSGSGAGGARLEGLPPTTPRAHGSGRLRRRTTEQVYNAPIVANGVLYFGTANGSIYAYAPS